MHFFLSGFVTGKSLWRDLAGPSYCEDDPIRYIDWKNSTELDTNAGFLERGTATSKKTLLSFFHGDCVVWSSSEHLGDLCSLRLPWMGLVSSTSRTCTWPMLGYVFSRLQTFHLNLRKRFVLELSLPLRAVASSAAKIILSYLITYLDSTICSTNLPRHGNLCKSHVAGKENGKALNGKRVSTFHVDCVDVEAQQTNLDEFRRCPLQNGMYVGFLHGSEYLLSTSNGGIALVARFRLHVLPAVFWNGALNCQKSTTWSGRKNHFKGNTCGQVYMLKRGVGATCTCLVATPASLSHAPASQLSQSKNLKSLAMSYHFGYARAYAMLTRMGFFLTRNKFRTPLREVLTRSYASEGFAYAKRVMTRPLLNM